MSPLGVVQKIVTRYQAIADDTLYLGDRQPRAIFEVFPPNLSLADDDALEATAQQLAVVFNALAFPTQLLFRFVAVDLEQLAVEAERAAVGRGPELARAARDYAALLRHLSRTLVLLELHVYLIVGLDGAHGSFLQAADFFGEPTNVALDARLTVFNVSALGEELWPIGLHLIEQFVWTQVRWHYVQGAEEPCLLVVDELWLTLRSAEGGVFLESLARKGPKYWLGLAVASQEPADCLNSPHGLAIVHNSSTHVLLVLFPCLRGDDAHDRSDGVRPGRALCGQSLRSCSASASEPRS